MPVALPLERLCWPVRVGVLVEQVASTNTNPGFDVSVSVTVLVAVLFDGFHW
jgi:hypothetical protein